MQAADLKRLGRRDLVDIVYTLRQELTQAQQERDALAKELEDRRITAEQAGSIAQASLSLNGVFEAAQAAADQYVLSVKAALDEQGLQALADLEAGARARSIIEDAEKRAEAILAEANARARLVASEAARAASALNAFVDEAPANEAEPNESGESNENEGEVQ